MCMSPIFLLEDRCVWSSEIKLLEKAHNSFSINYNGKLYTFFDDGNKIYYIIDKDTNNPVEVVSGTFPSVAYDGNKVYLAYKFDNNLKVKYTTDFVGWEDISPGRNRILGGTGPSIVYFKDKVYVFFSSWLESDIYVAVYSNGKWITGYEITPSIIGYDAAQQTFAIVYNDRIYLFYDVTIPGISGIVYSYTEDGENWITGKEIAGQWYTLPKAAILDIDGKELLYVFYRDKEDYQVYYKVSDGYKWTDQYSLFPKKEEKYPTSAIGYDNKLLFFESIKENDIWNTYYITCTLSES